MSRDTPDAAPVLAVENLVTEFKLGETWHPAVRDLSFTLARNETLALVGESGCGKSITALSIMGLVPKPAGRIASGRILLEGRDLVPLPEAEMECIRGDRVAMIFQEPMTSLNPVLTIGFQVAEALRYHRGLSARAADAEALRLLEEVKIPSVRARYHEYPHQFSGRMRQRVMVAMALACQPSVLLADEPTTALDVTIQAQVLGLLDDLRREHGMAMLFITHNLGVVAAIADRMAVMYAGEIVEIGLAARVFSHPTHPCTEALFSAIPRVDRPLRPALPAGRVALPRRRPGAGGGVGHARSCRALPCARTRASGPGGEPSLTGAGRETRHARPQGPRRDALGRQSWHRRGDCAQAAGAGL